MIFICDHVLVTGVGGFGIINGENFFDITSTEFYCKKCGEKIKLHDKNNFGGHLNMKQYETTPTWLRPDAEYTEWIPVPCDKCEEIKPLDRFNVCKDCFEPKEKR